MDTGTGNCSYGMNALQMILLGLTPEISENFP
jgi:hypothetical protein